MAEGNWPVPDCLEEYYEGYELPPKQAVYISEMSSPAKESRAIKTFQAQIIRELYD